MNTSALHQAAQELFTTADEYRRMGEQLLALAAAPARSSVPAVSARPAPRKRPRIHTDRELVRAVLEEAERPLTTKEIAAKVNGDGRAVRFLAEGMGAEVTISNGERHYSLAKPQAPEAA